jgi:hypothetical protein
MMSAFCANQPLTEETAQLDSAHARTITRPRIRRTIYSIYDTNILLGVNNVNEL